MTRVSIMVQYELPDDIDPETWAEDVYDIVATWQLAPGVKMTRFDFTNHTTTTGWTTP